MRKWKGKWSKTDAAIRGEARVEERNERLENGRAENQDETVMAKPKDRIEGTISMIKKQAPLTHGPQVVTIC